jgi:hypothetical protein
VKKQTFEPLVSSLALRAALVPFLALVLVARAADREGALVAGNEYIAGGRDPDGVPAYLADSRSFWLLTLHRQDRENGQHIPIENYTTSQQTQQFPSAA